MKWIIVHRYVGALLMLLFLLSGAYMYETFPAIYEGNEAIRYQFRANHIYILMASLIHLSVGLLTNVPLAGWRSAAQKTGAVFMCLASLLLLVAFVVDPIQGGEVRAYSFFGVVFMLAGVVLLQVRLLPGATSRAAN